MLSTAQMTSFCAPRLVLQTLSFCLVLAALPPAETEAQPCTDCDSGMDAALPEDATVAAPTALDGSLEAGVLADGGPRDAAIVTTVVAVGLDASVAAALDASNGTNQGGVTWVHEGCSLSAATAGRANVAAYAGMLAAMTLLLRRRARRAL